MTMESLYVGMAEPDAYSFAEDCSIDDTGIDDGRTGMPFLTAACGRRLLNLAVL